MYYVVGERLLRAGAAEAYIAYAQRVSRDWADVTNQDAYSLFLDRDHGQRVLIVGSWPNRAAFHQAYAAIPPEQREMARDAVVEGTGDWRWYVLAGELRLYGHEPRVATATRFRVDPRDVAAVRAWSAELRTAARNVPGLVMLRLLEAIEQPGELVQLGVYADEVGADLVGSVAGDLPAPVPLHDRREFVGLVGFQWSQYDSKGRRP